jgi:hypothetical protein
MTTFFLNSKEQCYHLVGHLHVNVLKLIMLRSLDDWLFIFIIILLIFNESILINFFRNVINFGLHYISAKLAKFLQIYLKHSKITKIKTYIFYVTVIQFENTLCYIKVHYFITIQIINYSPQYGI